MTQPPAPGNKHIRQIDHSADVWFVVEERTDEKPIEIPKTVRVVGALLLPVWAAIGAIAAVAISAKIDIERAED